MARATNDKTARKTDAESGRLDDARRGKAAWKKWGPYLSERQWGTVREDYSEDGRRLELLHARSGALACLSLGRGRARRDLRRPAAPLLRRGPVERQGSDPQGAAVRPDQQRGQPRRGRQGVLLLPRLDADALVHEVPLQVSAGGVSVRRSRRDQRQADAAGIRVRTARHRRVRSGPLLRRVRRVRQGVAGRHPDSDHRRTIAAPSRRRCTCCRRSGSATRGRGAAMRHRPALAAGRPPGDDRAPRIPTSASGFSACEGADDAALHRERDQHRAPLRRAQSHSVRQGRHRRLHRPRQKGGGESRRTRDEGGRALRTCRGCRQIAHRAVASVRATPARKRSAADSKRRCRRAGTRPTSSTPRSFRRRSTPIGRT